MSSRRSYSREARSYYSRSSSCERNRSHSSSYRHRPLSSLLIERDSPTFALDRFDDPFFFERPSRKLFDDFDRRIRSRFYDDDDEFFGENFFQKNSLDFGRNIPINSREYNHSTSITRNIPVQYTTSSSSANQREKVYKKLEDVDLFNNGTFQTRENRISTNDWPVKQESPTRKRTSMTIFVRQPHIQYSDVPNHQRTTSSSGYSTTYRTNY